MINFVLFLSSNIKGGDLRVERSALTFSTLTRVMHISSLKLSQSYQATWVLCPLLMAGQSLYVLGAESSSFQGAARSLVWFPVRHVRGAGTLIGPIVALESFFKKKCMSTVNIKMKK